MTLRDDMLPFRWHKDDNREAWTRRALEAVAIGTGAGMAGYGPMSGILGGSSAPAAGMPGTMESALADTGYTASSLGNALTLGPGSGQSMATTLGNYAGAQMPGLLGNMGKAAKVMNMAGGMQQPPPNPPPPPPQPPKPPAPPNFGGYGDDSMQKLQEMAQMRGMSVQQLLQELQQQQGRM